MTGLEVEHFEHYVGITSEGDTTVFAADFEPTPETVFGARFAAYLGPFKTKAGADEFAPHVHKLAA